MAELTNVARTNEEEKLLAQWTPAIAQRSWLVVPLYNEEQVIFDVLTQALEVFPNIVCVNDGSRDQSAHYARLAGAHVVDHPINLGQGAALQTGIEYALSDPDAQYFVTFDSDGQHRTIDAVKMVLRLASEDLDVVIGSRFLDNRTKPGVIKKIVLKLAVMFQRATTGVALTDAHNGLRALNRHAAQTIRIVQNRMAHASEIISEISKHDLAYSEEPVHIVYTDYSRSKGQSLWNSVNILSDLLFK
ncbi:glycosyltransferase family 2 protein [Arcanobacterium pinnipediorum]|uniref:Glycosyltransferase family 2 protein n=1 Tax=Arcanobacterium pinnipediorum TaxID=1503041 RepID=A0ABY5AGY9_9ACTO|nr:glycosyltransferase family 2 protein [Arcanobacterium pinnipediorum]USR79459.1 glycosyltransferase family 2 protein [Arcanobacterium pinnipediorum]